MLAQPVSIHVHVTSTLSNRGKFTGPDLDYRPKPGHPVSTNTTGPHRRPCAYMATVPGWADRADHATSDWADKKNTGPTVAEPGKYIYFIGPCRTSAVVCVFLRTITACFIFWCREMLQFFFLRVFPRNGWGRLAAVCRIFCVPAPSARRVFIYLFIFCVCFCDQSRWEGRATLFYHVPSRGFGS